MALSSASHEPFFVTTGTGKDKVDTDDLTNITAAWAVEKAEGCAKYIADPILAPLIYQLQKMQDELDYLRTEISANKDKTGITTDQANAITANTAKTSMTLGTTGSTALAGDTKIVGYVGSSDTNITIGNMASTVVKGVTQYTLPITVTQSGTDKLGNPTTLTKTGAITLT